MSADIMSQPSGTVELHLSDLVECPNCGVSAGKLCRTGSGGFAKAPHFARVVAALPDAHHEMVSMEYGRLLIRNGRAWLPLTDSDVERGATAVVSDPTYRTEIARSALMHADEIDDRVLHAALFEAWHRLSEAGR